MSLCFFCPCHAPHFLTMSRLSPATGISSRLHSSVPCGFRCPRNEFPLLQRRFRFVIRAQLSDAFSPDLGLDSQAVKSRDTSNLPWIGPVPGDIAEVEAYCRIFRSAERLHGALMETLCNPLTGECRVPYDFSPEEKPLLEDKIVSVLGCILSLLSKGRKEILSGRSSSMNSFSLEDVGVAEETLPPLAIFRGEMKRCCESLHIALENYLTPDDERSGIVWRKLQKLKNVCYDAGFPRSDNYPCQTLFANWDPIYAPDMKGDVDSNKSGIAFWRGGQVTEEGLMWLIEKGFKTIVDLRAENVKDIFYQAALDDAISLGKITVVKIPIEVRMAPKAQQVELFASIVSDSSKRPIYVHSKEGVWRTSAMVSRWKQYMTRPMTKEIPVSEESKCREVSESMLGLNAAASGKGVPDKHTGKVAEISEVDSKSAVNRSKEYGSNQGDTSESEFNMVSDPLKAQVPPGNIFSRKEMSKFLRSKVIAPAGYLSYQSKKLETVATPEVSYAGVTNGNQIVDRDSLRELAETGNSNGSLLPDRSQSLNLGNGNFSNGNLHASGNTNASISSKKGNGFSGEPIVVPPSNNLSRTIVSKPVRESQKNDSASSSDSSDDEAGGIEGNMCASTTGVVRVQSRKKAEMFLVRTDGVSCTREKVTESSLAFTHPSTQQQMLLWKTTPRTVLLLKKLGQELMEEAKEVTLKTFLIYKFINQYVSQC